MIFDSEKQKEQIMRLVLESPVQTTIGGILSGPTEEVVTLVNKVRDAKVATVAQQEEAMVALVEKAFSRFDDEKDVMADDLEDF